MTDSVQNIPMPADDSLERFAADLKAIVSKEQSGLSVRDIASAANISPSSVSDLYKGERLPREDFLVRVLEAIKSSPDEVEVWKSRLSRLKNPSPAQDPPPSKWRMRLVMAVAIFFTAAVASAITWWIARPDPSDAAPAATRPVVIKVQNKVALGADVLKPDQTPAYLSTKRVARCAAKGCKVPDTEMDSDVLLVSICQADGEELVNYNLDSTSAENPHRAKSTRWYMVRLPDGREGYLSEVYVVAEDRGGFGLPRCAS